jgi:hypothetical protein
MHPTLTLPELGEVIATAEQVARMRTYLLAHTRHTYESRHSFAEGYLTSVIRSLANGTPSDLVHITITQALAVIAAVEQLDAEADGFNTTGREDPETGEPLPAGVEGYSLGRHAR